MFVNGNTVKLEGTSGSVVGELHLPNAVFFTQYGIKSEPRQTSGGYGLHTLILPDGNRYRSKGRLTRA